MNETKATYDASDAMPLPPQGGSLAWGSGMGAALETCAACGKAEQHVNHVCCIFRLHDGVCPGPERHHAYVPLATRQPDATCEDCGGPAWKPLLCCAACYPKRVAKAMLRKRAEEAEQWGHADDCASHIHGKYACDCGLWNYREEAKAAAL